MLSTEDYRLRDNLTLDASKQMRQPLFSQVHLDGPMIVFPHVCLPMIVIADGQRDAAD